MAGNDTRGRWFTPLTAVVKMYEDESGPLADLNKKRFKMIQYLLTVPGIDVGIRIGEAGWTALHEAAYNGAASVLELLLPTSRFLKFLRYDVELQGLGSVSNI